MSNKHIDWQFRRPEPHKNQAVSFSVSVLQAVDRITEAQGPGMKRSPVIEQLLLTNPIVQQTLKEIEHERMAESLKKRG